METSNLRFVASISVCPSDIEKLRKHLGLSKLTHDPLRDVLISPLFVNPGTVKAIKNLSDEGKSIIFDSGGYNVQIGKLSYEELYFPLLNFYRNNRWASIYTLPDQVPLSQDSIDMVQIKVNNTITFSTLFFNELPDELKPKAMPVVQGHTQKQIDKSLEAYIKLGVNWIGFGSFGTQGKNSEVNIPTINSVKLAQYVIRIAHEHKIKVHIFGLGAPPFVAMIKGIGCDSFDSASWLKAAGFGMVSLPFMRFYNISHRNKHSEFQRGIGIDDFNYLRKITGHSCELCDDILNLQERKMYRAAHNLISLSESIELINNDELEKIQYIYENGSIKYKGEFRKWLQLN
jgi:hypothetical protein